MKTLKCDCCCELYEVRELKIYEGFRICRACIERREANLRAMLQKDDYEVDNYMAEAKSNFEI